MKQQYLEAQYDVGDISHVFDKSQEQPPALSLPYSTSEDPDFDFLDSCAVPSTALYTPVNRDEFGFDLPEEKLTCPELDLAHRTFECGHHLYFGCCPSCAGDGDVQRVKPAFNPTYGVNGLTLPDAANAVVRFDQLTPPRTASTSSCSSTLQPVRGASLEAASPDRSPSTKSRQKSTQTHTLEPNSRRRKRKKTTKAAADAAQSPIAEDTKRRTKLEQNRVAAAKCRSKSKVQSEQLQHDARDKSAQNVFLNAKIVCMKEEIQQISAILADHAKYEGCKSPTEIQTHLRHTATEVLAQQMRPAMYRYDDFSPT